MSLWIGFIFVVLAIVLLGVSYLQFKNKGFLLNNAYILASKKERGRNECE